MPRFLHTSIFVNDMKESIAFYTEKLGLRLLDGPFHYPGNADMAFVGSDWNAYIELVYDLEEHPPYASAIATNIWPSKPTAICASMSTLFGPKT